MIVKLKHSWFSYELWETFKDYCMLYLVFQVRNARFVLFTSDMPMPLNCTSWLLLLHERKNKWMLICWQMQRNKIKGTFHWIWFYINNVLNSIDLLDWNCNEHCNFWYIDIVYNEIWCMQLWARNFWYG